MTTISDLPEAFAAAAAAGTEPIRVCGYAELTAGRGAAVLLPGGGQAAVFRTLGGTLHAVGNLDPATGAQVISRGLTGSRDGAATVASPLLKHVYELATGRCVDGPAGAEPALALPVFPVFCDNGVVYVLDDPAHHDGGTP
ncbi:MAG TPA: nitrite reductase (NAD(P)H) small subunit [Actinospica sp.]|jgi:nitrite reductase (NADH) small subunit|nr:nitrite reductase (NAD(P)H) small subunit [Actinospica sp.]